MVSSLHFLPFLLYLLPLSSPRDAKVLSSCECPLLEPVRITQRVLTWTTHAERKGRLKQLNIIKLNVVQFLKLIFTCSGDNTGRRTLGAQLVQMLLQTRRRDLSTSAMVRKFVSWAKGLASIVQRLANAIQWINNYSAKKFSVKSAIESLNGYCYPAFEQVGPG